MDSEISLELKQSLLTELINDGQRISQTCVRMQQPPAMEYSGIYSSLEQLAYITEQMRLKLKILGAPRMY